MLNQEPDPPEEPQSGLYADDVQLVRSALAGDEEARETLARRLECVGGFVRLQNRRRGAFIRKQELPDLVQDVLSIAWRKLPEFAGRSKLETWVFGICHFEVLSRTRSSRPFEQRLPDWGAGADSEEPTGRESAPSDHFEHESLELGLSRLQDADEEILRAKHYDELSFEAIGRMLGLSTSGAKSRYYLALRRLRHAMPDSESFENPGSPHSRESS